MFFHLVWFTLQLHMARAVIICTWENLIFVNFVAFFKVIKIVYVAKMRYVLLVYNQELHTRSFYVTFYITFYVTSYVHAIKCRKDNYN